MLNFAPIRRRLCVEVRSDEVRVGEEGKVASHLHTVCSMFTNHIMQNNGPGLIVSTNASFPQFIVYLYTVVYGLCLRYLSELPTVFYHVVPLILTDC